MEDITTLKLTKKTKSRLESLRSYKNESSEEILVKMLEILNLLKANSSHALDKLLTIDKQHKELLKKS